MQEHGSLAAVEVALGTKRRLEHRSGTRIGSGGGGAGLVGEQLGLDDDTERFPERLDFVEDRGDGALDE